MVTPYRWFRILVLAYAALLVWYQGGTIDRLREDQRFLADGWEHAAKLCIALAGGPNFYCQENCGAR